MWILLSATTILVRVAFSIAYFVFPFPAALAGRLTDLDIKNIIIPESELISMFCYVRKVINSEEFFKYNVYSENFYKTNWRSFSRYDWEAILETVDCTTCDNLFTQFSEYLKEQKVDVNLSNFSPNFVFNNINMFDSNGPVFVELNVSDMRIIDKYFISAFHGWDFMNNEKVPFEFKARVFKKMRDKGTCMTDNSHRIKKWPMQILLAKVKEL